MTNSTFFDTHCHLNFGAFDGRVDEVIKRAKEKGVSHIVIPGTDYETSVRAIAIAEKHEGVYAAVGIHPHHVFKLWTIENRGSKIEPQSSNLKTDLLSSTIDRLSLFFSHTKVVAIGEVGIDRHMYKKTKYPDYKIEEEFVALQKEFLIEQIKLAVKHKKALIIHSREAKKDILEVLTTGYTLLPTPYSSVFHCCEPDMELLNYAKAHKFFIGVDGDVAYTREKQEFIKSVPLEMLVLETDSPFLSPAKKFPNEPMNIPLIAQIVADLKKIPVDEVARMTTNNSKKLFSL